MTRFVGRTLATGVAVLAALYVVVWATEDFRYLLAAACLLPAAALIAFIVLLRQDVFRESRARAAATVLGLVLATAATWWVWADFLSAIGED